MPDNRLTYLLQRYFEDNATSAETGELMELIEAPGSEEEVKAILDEGWMTFQEKEPVFSVDRGRAILQGILSRRRVPSRGGAVLLRRWLPAAAAAILLFLAGYWWLQRTQPLPIVQAPPPQDALPGKSGAILTLANGSTIVLDSAGNGHLASQGTTKIIKLDSGRLAYQAPPPANDQSITYNTLTTPRGRQFQVELPDGTRVWLNAASSLRYPTAFTGRERRVEITGEAYFEVSSDAAKPFVVKTEGQEIRVLGTRFNINAYPDESATYTTLLDGAVQVSNSGASLTLKPGQQARSQPGTPLQRVPDPDLDATMAWKNGFFSFRHAGIRTVMRELSRWYDVQVEYQDGVDETQSFSGEIGRNLLLSDLMNGLKLTRVHYRIENKKLMITP